MRESSLDIQIEKLRTKMYEAYRSNKPYKEILEISQQLDKLLNQLSRKSK
ncbi:Spo0E family sporulation regulatory protein-aspartic acid phosphatase [Halobacillus sp. B23F22_1]